VILKGKGLPIEEHPFPVWEANVSKVGFLPADLAAKAAGFNSLAAGIVQDVADRESTGIQRKSFQKRR
jgi:hypothetical protein